MTKQVGGRSFWVTGFLVAACGPADPSPQAGARERVGPAWFEERARARGIDFRLRSGHEPGRFLFPEIMCGGAALFDADGDGDLEAYLVQAGTVTAAAAANPPNQLFVNDGAGNFEDVTRVSGAGDRGYGMGVAAGDVDGDGDQELYVSNLAANVLLVNGGGLRFVDGTERAGVGDSAWSVSSVFFDAERDGDLDLYVTNYVFWSRAGEIVCDGIHGGPDYCSPKAYGAPAPDTLYRNDGQGVFRDVSLEANLRTAFGNGLGVICADFDGDGWTDVFVANDGTPNQLWRNQGDGSFRDQGLSAGVALDDDGGAKAGMGVAASDLDFDADEDLLVVNMARQADSLHFNQGDYFTDRTVMLGLGVASRSFTRFGCAFADFDNDGFDDVFEANGRVVRGLGSEYDDPYAEENLVFRGGEQGVFEEVSPRGGTRTPLAATSRAAAFGDVDGDGGIDVLIANRDGAAHLLLNAYPRRGHWLSVRVSEADAQGVSCVAQGARVTLRTNELVRRRTVRSAYSYAAANDWRVHFGLGQQTRAALEVLWPDGTEERFGSFGVDRVIEVVRGRGERIDR